MRPPLWSPPIELAPAERAIVKRINRAKLFTFLRQERHTLFDAVFPRMGTGGFKRRGCGKLFESHRN